jgi:hypothetical protein
MELTCRQAKVVAIKMFRLHVFLFSRQTITMPTKQMTHSVNSMAILLPSLSTHPSERNDVMKETFMLNFLLPFCVAVSLFTEADD